MIYTLLLAALGIVGTIGRLWWGKRKAESRAERAEVARDAATGRADVAEATIAVTAEVRAGQVAGREAAREAARDPAVVAATTPAARIDAATDLLRKERTRGKIRRLAEPRKRGGK